MLAWVTARRPQAPVGEPHFADPWAGHRFSPRLIAPTDSAVWVTEGLLPLLARIDPLSGEVTGPFALDRPKGSTGGAHAVVATSDAVWVRWNNGLTRFDPRTGTARTLEVLGLGLAAGDEGVWVLPGDGRVARVDDQASAVHPLGEPEERRDHIAVGHGSVWTLASTEVHSKVSALSRLDPQTGAVEHAISLEGSPRSLVVDTSGVWVRLWRGHRNITDSYVRVDPQTAEPAGGFAIVPVGADVLVHGGFVYASTTDPFAHAERGKPSHVLRIDARTGALLGSYALPGWVDSMVGGGAGAWACLSRRDESPRQVVELSAEANSFRTWSLDSVDVFPHLPPPPPRIEARPTEEQVCDRLARSLFGGWIATDPETGAETRLPYIHGIEFEDVRLEGQFPDTEVVALFRSVDHPGVRFGRRRRIWDNNGAFLIGLIDVMDVNLMEDVEACGYGLPQHPEPDDSGIAWF
jgi:hypothetical protein